MASLDGIDALAWSEHDEHGGESIVFAAASEREWKRGCVFTYAPKQAISSDRVTASSSGLYPAKRPAKAID